MTTNDESIASPRALSWTSERPTVPGWYWCYESADGSMRVTELGQRPLSTTELFWGPITPPSPPNPVPPPVPHFSPRDEWWLY